MEILQLLTTALGVSAFAGINLYLTVFATSLALNLGWLELSPELQSLSVLGNPAILMVSGCLYFLEFFVDKIPGLDSLWDTIHTAIRPIGAVMLSLAVLGDLNVILEVVAALVCGGIAMTTHITKAGTRALINTSPEPFSNITASIGEDVLVAGGLASVYSHPLITAAAVLAFLCVFVYLAPRLLRNILTTARFAYHKLTSSGVEPEEPAQLKVTLPSTVREELDRDLGPEEKPAWSVSVITGKTSSLPANRSTHLVMTAPDRRLGLIVPGKPVIWFSKDQIEISHNTRMLFDEMVFLDREKRKSFSVRFNKKQISIIKAIINDLSADTC
ncbi:MAG TPA: DUF4126 domain-containing protein [Thermodesulfobacteriaceae bacterium]|nr:DUF4126 domain-containing protein [Thermodesulfobacteriaceae bacterium]